MNKIYKQVMSSPESRQKKMNGNPKVDILVENLVNQLS